MLLHHTIEKTKDGQHVKSKINPTTTSRQQPNAGYRSPRPGPTSAPTIASDFQFVEDYQTQTQTTATPGLQPQHGVARQHLLHPQQNPRQTLHRADAKWNPRPSQPHRHQSHFVMVPDWKPQRAAVSSYRPTPTRRQGPLPRRHPRRPPAGDPVPALWLTNQPEARHLDGKPSPLRHTTFCASTNPSSTSSPTTPTLSCSPPAPPSLLSTPAKASSSPQPNNRDRSRLYCAIGIFKKSSTPSADRVNRVE